MTLGLVNWRESVSSSSRILRRALRGGGRAALGELARAESFSEFGACVVDVDAAGPITAVVAALRVLKNRAAYSESSTRTCSIVRPTVWTAVAAGRGPVLEVSCGSGKELPSSVLRMLFGRVGSWLLDSEDSTGRA